MARYVQTRGEAYRWGMLTWFNQLLLEQGVITEAEFRQMRLAIEKKMREPKKTAPSEIIWCRSFFVSAY